MLLVLDAGQQRCPMCRTRFGSRTQPVVLGENQANTAPRAPAHARPSGTEHASSGQHATTSVEVDEPVRHRRHRRAPKTDGMPAAPICEALFEAAALVEPQPKTLTPLAKPTIVDIPEEAIRAMRTTVDAPEVFYATTAVKPKPAPEPLAPVANVAPPVAPSPPAPRSAPLAPPVAPSPPVPAPVPVAAPVVPPAFAPVRIPPPIARVVAPPAVPAPLVRRHPEPAPVDSIHALPPEPRTARVRWWDRIPLRWTIEFVERPEPDPARSEPAPRPKPRAVEAPKAPARARVAPVPAPDSPRPAPQPREPNPMWRDLVFRGAPDDAQHAPVTWPRRSDA